MDFDLWPLPNPGRAGGIVLAARTVEGIMRRSIKLLASIAVGTAFLGVSPALAVDPPLAVYRTTFYSDSSHQTEIGHTQLRYCTYDYETNGSVMWLVGSSSSYHDDELIGYCDEGNFEPIF